MIDANIKQAILDLQSKYPHRRSALIPALHIVQDAIGYLPLDAQAEVAELFDLPTNEVCAIVSFYELFYDKPQGKHHIHVCKNISCMLRGSDQLIEKLCDKLQVAPGGTTKDGLYTLIPSECLGACDRAPMMIVGKDVVGPVTDSDIEALIAKAVKI